MKKKNIYSTVTIQHEILSNQAFEVNFKSLLLNLDTIVTQVGKTDYCFFIDFIKTESGTLTKVHDGGKTYDEEANDFETKIYFERKSIFQVISDYKLQFSMDDYSFSFLNER